MLVEIVAAAALEESRNADELTRYLLEIFRGADLEGHGLLHKQDVLDLLRRGDFGLRKIQLLAVLAEAEMDEHGFITYEKLASPAAFMIKSIWEQNCDLDRAAKMAQIVQENGDDMLIGRPRDEVMAEVEDVFKTYDVDGNNTLDKDEFKNCLNQTGLLGKTLEEKEMNHIMMGVDENEDGRIDYNEFVNFVIEVLQYYY